MNTETEQSLLKQLCHQLQNQTDPQQTQKEPSALQPIYPE